MYEIETQLLIADELRYVDEEKLKAALSEIEQCKKRLNGFIKYFESKATKN